MTGKNRKIAAFGTVLALGALVLAVSMAGPALALDTGINATATEAGINVTDTNNIYDYVGLVMNALLGLVGTLFLILTIYNGVLWMTAQGDKGQVAKAQEGIVRSIIGMIVIFSAYFITDFVLGIIGI